VEKEEEEEEEEEEGVYLSKWYNHTELTSLLACHRS
jgi:hypothetical protein